MIHIDICQCVFLKKNLSGDKFFNKTGIQLYTNFIIILDEINGIRYSQNELDNGNLTAIQLVNYLRISYLQKIFHTLLCPSNCTSLLQNLILINNLVDIFECLFFYMNLISNYLEFGNCRFNFTDNIAATTCLYSHFVTSLH